MDDFEQELKRDFINEALMNLEEAESCFMELESGEDTKPMLAKIFRLAHNLKGGSRAVGFADVAEFTHIFENLVLKIQNGEIGLNPALVSTLLTANDRLAKMLNQLKTDMTLSFDNQDVIAELQSWVDGKNPAAGSLDVDNSAGVAAAPSATQFAEMSDQNESSEASIADDNPAAANVVNMPNPSSNSGSGPGKKNSAVKANSKNSAKDEEIVRVSIGKINKLNDYVGELIVLQSVIQQLIGVTSDTKLQASLRLMTKISKDIQTISMGLRLLPVKPLIQKLQRVVRDTAQAVEKEIKLEVEGEQLDIDKSVYDQLADPLIHILRNGVDHGIEPAADRIIDGKAPEGIIKLSLKNQGNDLVVEVSDDGKGIDPVIIRQKAIEKGLISANQDLTEKQIINLIFHPGFSTKAVTSEISGRGVGMDVVKTNISQIGGTVDVQSVVGKGSFFQIKIPLTLAVIDGIIIMSGQRRYVIPLSQVNETLNLKSYSIQKNRAGIGHCINLRGIVVPLLNLEELLGQKKQVAHEDATALVVIVDEQPIALVVDDVVRSQQVVVKPLTNGVEAQKGWSGSCVLGDGLPTLILSPIDLLEGRVTSSFKNLNEGTAA